MTAAIRMLALALLVCSCATGGKDGGNDQPVDAAVTPTDSNQVSVDGRVTDAAPMGDAATPDSNTSMTPDASTGPFCNGNSECTVSGECCVTVGGPGFCAPGTPVGNLCLPD